MRPKLATANEADPGSASASAAACSPSADSGSGSGLAMQTAKRRTTMKATVMDMEFMLMSFLEFF